MRKSPDKPIYHEIAGLLLIGGSILLFLALVSYDPKDVPEGLFLATEGEANSQTRNFAGKIGAYGGSLFLYLFGVAAYLMTTLTMAIGAVKLVVPTRRIPWFWLIVLLISGACVIQVQPWFFKEWSRWLGLAHVGAGGEVGYWVGTRFFRLLFGPLGSLLILLALYGVSLAKSLGLPPMLLVRKGVAGVKITYQTVRRWWPTLSESVEREASPTPRRAERKRANRATSTPVDEEGEPVFDPNRPAPQIIDTTAPPVRKNEPKKERAKTLIFNSSGDMSNYQLPPVELLAEQGMGDREAADTTEMVQLQEIIIETLAQFGITVAPGDITRGPTITRYEVYPAKGIRVDKIVSLERDIARATCAERINIIAPIPGKDTVGIELANAKKQKVALRELLESDEWENTKAKIPLVLGKDVYGKTILGDLAGMPHLLVAGTTGSGKSVCINSIIASIIYRFNRDELRFIMIDPKVVEMQVYNKLPHLAIPVVTDPKKVILALRWIIDEMETRYKIFAKVGVRNITSFNARPKPKTQAELDAEAALKAAEQEDGKEGEGSDDETPPWEEPDENALEEASEEPPPAIRVRRDDEVEIPEGPMPYIVVIIDELADLMQTAPADVESGIARITQMARAAGIHMIVATQTPRADVITGVIKANIPTRIAFQVASALDSRIILDEKGAERLLGQGDMLYVPPGTSRTTRAQGVFVTDEEIRSLVDFCAKHNGGPSYHPEIENRLSNSGEAEEISEEDEELVQKCIEIMKQERKASTSLFQRRLRLGYTRAARVVDILEQRRYVAAGEGAKPREILVDLDELI